MLNNVFQTWHLVVEFPPENKICFCILIHARLVKEKVLPELAEGNPEKVCQYIEAKHSINIANT